MKGEGVNDCIEDSLRQSMVELSSPMLYRLGFYAIETVPF